MNIILKPSLSLIYVSMFTYLLVFIQYYCKTAIMPTEALGMFNQGYPPPKISTSATAATSPFIGRCTSTRIIPRVLQEHGTKLHPLHGCGRRHSADRPRAMLLVHRSSTNNHDDKNEFTEPSLVQSSSSKEYIILSFDGIIADTSRQRAKLTLDVALHIWPQLQDLLNSIRDKCGKEMESTIQKEHDLNSNNIDNWLINKMVACSHVTQDHTTDGMLGCDDVLLARLLIEEEKVLLQETSAKNFNGKGKYASKFHPKIITYPSTATSTTTTDSNGDHSTTDEDEGKQNKENVEISNFISCRNNTFQDSTSQTKKVYKRNHSRSRPLTVGEICANWSTGGHLRDTLRTRYNIDGKDPLPIIRETLEMWFSVENITDIITSTIPPLIKEAMLLGCRGGKNIYILLNHAAYTKQALKILSTYNVEVVLQNSPSTTTTLSHGYLSPTSPTSTSTSNDGWCSNSSGRLTILGGSTDSSEDTHVNLLKRLMEEVTDFSDFFFIHGNSHVLHDAKRLLYGDSPYTMKAQRKTRIGTQRSLALFLPYWRSKNNFSPMPDVELDPWITKINEVDFLELLTANKIQIET